MFECHSSVTRRYVREGVIIDTTDSSPSFYLFYVPLISRSHSILEDLSSFGHLVTSAAAANASSRFNRTTQRTNMLQHHSRRHSSWGMQSPIKPPRPDSSPLQKRKDSPVQCSTRKTRPALGTIEVCWSAHLYHLYSIYIYILCTSNVGCMTAFSSTLRHA